MDTDAYLLGRSGAEEARLRKQVEELEGEARWLLDQLDIQPGARAIDLACGPRGILDLLSERVGPAGQVVGVEKSEQFVDSARKFVASRQLGNVEVLQGDAKATGLPPDSFDVGHARLVLVNVPEPERIIAELVGLVRPGGMIASHEADYLAHICAPPSPAWNRLFEMWFRLMLHSWFYSTHRKEAAMAWKRVENYWLGYNLLEKQFYFYYKLADENSLHQIFPNPQEFMALADMFRNEGPINFNTDGSYFVSAAEEIGEQEAHP